MALGCTRQDNDSSVVDGIDEKDPTGRGSVASNEDAPAADEQHQQEQSCATPAGICDICADFYHFLASGNY